MGIFSSIANAIFGSGARPRRSQQRPAQRQRPLAWHPQLSHRRRWRLSGLSAPAPICRADVEAQIAAIETKRGVKYNWNQSIVDLMKLLDLDSSLASRKELAKELGYKGALDGSAEMNTWLHKQVMEKLAASGGKVPESLKG